MFVDEAYIKVEGGKGGSGRAAFFPGIKTGPSGGDGGNGGNVYVKADRNKVDLYQFVSNRKYIAADGKIGENFKRTGASGEDLIVTVPYGTQFTDTETNETFEVTDEKDQYLLARGGHGGKGNAKFASPTNRS